MEFEFVQTVRCENSIDIEDVGNTIIETCTMNGYASILAIKTNLGVTQIIEYGPVRLDINILPDSLDYSYQKFQFNQKKIAAIIRKFLNSPGVESASEIDIARAKSLIKDIFAAVFEQNNFTDVDMM